MSSEAPENRQLVGARGDLVVVLLFRSVLTREEALAHAAWLVAVADPDGTAFAPVLAAVRSL